MRCLWESGELPALQRVRAYKVVQGSCDWAEDTPNGVKWLASCLCSWAGSSRADDTLASGAVALRPSWLASASLLTAAAPAFSLG